MLNVIIDVSSLLLLHSSLSFYNIWKLEGKISQLPVCKMTSKPKSLIKGLQCYIYYVYK